MNTNAVALAAARARSTGSRGCDIRAKLSVSSLLCAGVVRTRVRACVRVLDDVTSSIWDMGYRIVSIVSRWRVLDVSLRFDDGSGDLDVGEKMLYSFVEIRYTGKVFSFLDLVNVFKY